MELTRIPSLDYGAHPAYGGKLPRPSLEERASALRALLPHFFSYYWRDLKLSIRARKQEYTGPHPQKAAELAEAGITAFKIRREYKDQLIALTRQTAKELRERRSKRPARKLAVENSAERIAALNQPQTPIYQLVKKILEDVDFSGIAKSYCGFNLEPKLVNLQINDYRDGGIAGVFPDMNQSPPSTYYAHIDTGVKTLKVLIYLNEVTEDNGPFRFFEGSHRFKMSRFERSLRKACDIAGFESTNEDVRRRFMALPSILRRKANFGNDLLDGSAEASALLSTERLLTSDQGDLLLFDNNGVHRGAIFKSGERELVQISFLPQH